MKTKELTDDQVNLICASFENIEILEYETVNIEGNRLFYYADGPFTSHHDKGIYTEDLNSLAPIIREVCSKNDWNIKFYSDTFDQFSCFYIDIFNHVKAGYESEIFKKTLLETIAHCTALAILQIKPEPKELL